MAVKRTPRKLATSPTGTADHRLPDMPGFAAALEKTGKDALRSAGFHGDGVASRPVEPQAPAADGRLRATGELQQAWFNGMGRLVRLQLETVHDLLGCRGIGEMAALQRRCLQESMRAWMDQSAEIMQASGHLATAAGLRKQRDPHGGV